jgi:hypothetical protein
MSDDRREDLGNSFFPFFLDAIFCMPCLETMRMESMG